MQSLLTGAALAVDRDAGHRLGKTRPQKCPARRVAGLLTDLPDRAADDVVDLGRIDTGSRYELREDMCVQVNSCLLYTSPSPRD